MKLKLLVASIALVSSSAFSAIKADTEFGTITLSGNARIDNDVSSEWQKRDVKRNDQDITLTDKDNKSRIKGQVLLKINGEKTLANKYFAGFDVQPKLNVDGGYESEDVSLYFGQKMSPNQIWKLKAGRFEAYDLFPMLGDTYIYDAVSKTAKGRGRGNALNFSYRMNELYAEANILINQKDSFGNYIKNANNNNKNYPSNLSQNEFNDVYGYSYKSNEIYIRPVIGYLTKDFDLAAGFEFAPGRGFVQTNFDNEKDNDDFSNKLSSNNATYYSVGGTATYRVPNQPLKFTINGSYASASSKNYKNAFKLKENSPEYEKATEDGKVTSKITTVGLSAQYQNFAIGGIFEKNQFKNKPEGDNFTGNKKQFVSVYASYKFANTFGLKNLDTTIAGAYSRTPLKDNSKFSNVESTKKIDEPKHQLGARVRLQYNF